MARQLTIAFDATEIITGLTLSADAGTFTCVVGPNGSGKTTLMRSLAGELTPTSGTVTIGGTAPSALSARARATLRAFLAQEERPDVPYTVEEVVRFGTHLSELDGAGQQEIVVRAMHDVGIGNIADRVVGSLSGGERRRVALARTLAQASAVILLDEPTDSLDIAHADVAMRLVCDRAHEGATVLVTSHDLNLASRHADRIILMSHGAIVADGSPEAVLTPPLLSVVYECAVNVARHPDDGRPIVYL